MFSKPLKNVRRPVALRGADRRKLKQRIAQTYGLDAETSEFLAPEGLLSMKYTAHNDIQGVFYLAPDENPLWFTVEKQSEELIPSVYALWKHPTLLPVIFTTGTVIPGLLEGTDLMIADLVQPSTTLKSDTLVSITQHRVDGRAQDPAVLVLHIWQDHLWSVGTKDDPPVLNQPEEISDENDVNEHSEPKAASETERSESEEEAEDEVELSPEEISSMLRAALLQAIQTSLSSLQSFNFPIPTTVFYTSHILPARPISTSSVTPVDVKHSTFKSLSTFLRQAEKQGLLKLKESKSESFVITVSPLHPDVVAHTPYASLADLEVQEKKEKEESERSTITNLWKPDTSSILFFEKAGKDITALYTEADIAASLDAYIAERNLGAGSEQQEISKIRVDEALDAVLATEDKPAPDFATRDALAKAIRHRMQLWSRIKLGANEPVMLPGSPPQIQVQVKKQKSGGRLCTTVTGFEPFALPSGALVDALRARCGLPPSVSLGLKSGREEITVQGKQLKPAIGALLGLGIPQTCIGTAGKKAKGIGKKAKVAQDREKSKKKHGKK